MAIRSFDPHGATSKQRAAERVDNFAINAPGSGAGPGACCALAPRTSASTSKSVCSITRPANFPRLFTSRSN
jgi:hypothetical protein